VTEQPIDGTKMLNHCNMIRTNVFKYMYIYTCCELPFHGKNILQI